VSQFIETEFGIPCLSINAGLNYNWATIAYAATQAWLGTYFDLSNEIVATSLVASDGSFVPIATTQQILGPSDIIFDGVRAITLRIKRGV
jgi:hypothetical protein